MFDQDLLQGEVGTVPRDARGTFIGAVNREIETCYDVLLAEALASKFGLEFAQSFGCNMLTINPDNTEVIEVMNKGGGNFFTIATIHM